MLGECFVRVAQTVLSSRISETENASPSGAPPRRSSWVRTPPIPQPAAASLRPLRPAPHQLPRLRVQFKLELEEVRSARPALERWRGERGIGLPLVLEVRPAPQPAAALPSQPSALWKLLIFCLH